MPDPNVKSWTDKDGVQHWGAKPPASPEPDAPKPAADPDETPDVEVPADAAADAPNGDRPDTGRAKRRS